MPKNIDINYPAMVGVLDAKLAMFAYDLVKADLIKREDMETVEKMTRDMIEYAEQRGAEAFKQYAE